MTVEHVTENVGVSSARSASRGHLGLINSHGNCVLFSASTTPGRQNEAVSCMRPVSEVNGLSVPTFNTERVSSFLPIRLPVEGLSTREDTMAVFYSFYYQRDALRVQ